MQPLKDPAEVLSIAREVLRSVLGSPQDDMNHQYHLALPADTFAWTSSFLEATGAITFLVSSPPGMPWREPEWPKDVREIAQAWAKQVSVNAEVAPEGVQALWRQIVNSMKVTAREWDPRHLLGPLMRLHAAADEVCGILNTGMSALLASTSPSMATMPRRAGRVLPKFHAAQIGLTMRSASLHATFDANHALRVRWMAGHGCPSERPLNIVLLPWPFEVPTSSFAAANVTGIADQSEFGYFSYRAGPDAKQRHQLLPTLEGVLAAAANNLGMQIDPNDPEAWRPGAPGATIDGVILPECAMDIGQLNDQFYDLMRRFGVRFFMVGVGQQANGGWGKNFVAVGSRKVDNPGAAHKADLYTVVEQHKHHRWRLDEGQVRSYALSRVLDGQERVRWWWEAIDISSRQLTILQLHEHCAIAPLICEDLARQEPMGHTVRAIGPSLVVALLMDGPQYKERWSGAYATVLADDPGSSVLTLTSRGMIERWTSPHRNTSRVVALWKEASGPARELTLEQEGGLLLTLDQRYVTEFSADGRTAKRLRLTLREVLRISCPKTG
jgi:hypothetical protein